MALQTTALGSHLDAGVNPFVRPPRPWPRTRQLIMETGRRAVDNRQEARSEKEIILAMSVGEKSDLDPRGLTNVSCTNHYSSSAIHEPTGL